MKKCIIYLFAYFSSYAAICQPIIGEWEYNNSNNDKVIIEFGVKSQYKISLPGRDLSVIDAETGVKIATVLEYRIISGKPIGIEIVSKVSGQKFRGIIDFIDQETMQMQINPTLGGEPPKEFDMNSPNYIKLKRKKVLEHPI